MGLVTTIIFILTVVGAGGTFLYKKFLESSLNSKIEQLSQAEEKFDSALIEELIRLDRRLSAARTLVGSHRAVSNLFEEFEKSTSQSLRFKSFLYTRGRAGTGAGVESVILSGTAQDFGAVAYQSDVFGGNPLFQNVIFSDLAVNEFGNVGFKFSATLGSGLTDYKVAEGQAQ